MIRPLWLSRWPGLLALGRGVDQRQVAVDRGPVDQAMKIVERAGPTALAITEPEVLLPNPTPRHEPSPVPRTSSWNHANAHADAPLGHLEKPPLWLGKMIH